MYCSKKDSIVYGANIPLYKILYIKKTLKKVQEIIEKENKQQNRKKNILGTGVVRQQGTFNEDVVRQQINIRKRKQSFDLD